MHRAVLVGWLAAVLVGGPVWANPRHGDPDAAFDPLLKEAVSSVNAAAVKLYKQIVQANEKNLAFVNANQVERLDPDHLADTLIALRQLSRAAQQLIDAGETAGDDFLRRHTETQQVHSRLVNASMGLPTASLHLQKSRAIIARSQESRMKELKQIEEMARKGQWEPAETRLYKTLDQLSALTLYNRSTEEHLAIYGPYAEVQAAIDREMHRIRRQAASDLLAKMRDAQEPNFEGLLAEIAAAAQSVAAEGAVTIGDRRYDGPALIGYFAEKWKELHAATLRRRAIEWAMTGVRRGGSYYEEPDSNPQVDPWNARYYQFAAQIGPALLRIVEADAGRVRGPEVAPLHRAYVDALAPLVFHVSGDRFVRDAQRALDQLTTQAPEFHGQAVAYRTATEEMLRWRRRAAEAAAKARQTQYPRAGQRLLQATLGKAPFGGFFYEQMPDFPRAQLLASAPAVVHWAADKLLNQTVGIAPTTSLGPGQSAVSRFEDRTYCMVSAVPMPPEQLAALERDLGVSAAAPPLSLAAAAALDSAQRGHLLASGGVIRGYQFEGVLTRFGALPQAAWVLSPLGDLPVERETIKMSPHVLARFDVAPEWIRHEYFFAALPLATPQP